MLENKQFLFIVGAPRSGTSWLQMMIGSHPKVCTTVELTLFSRYTGKWIESWKQESENLEKERWHQGLPFLITEEEFIEILRDFIDRVYSRVLATKPEATHILDKHPGYSDYVSDINQLIPNAKFIHLIRDGRDVVVSMMAANKQIGFGTATIDSSAKAWVHHLIMARKACSFENNRYLEIRYEDLLDKGEETLKNIFDFCELDTNLDDIISISSGHRFEEMKKGRQSPVNGLQAPEGHYRKGKVGIWKDELNPIDRYLFNEIAGSLLAELGYAKDGWWAETKGQRYLIPFQVALSSPRRFNQIFYRGLLKLVRREIQMG